MIDRGPLSRWWLPAGVAIVPLLTAAVRALAGDWYPIGDNAFFTMRARDVLTDHHPLLGTWTSASLTVGTRINNPGPLLFDVLAGPAKIDIAAGTVLAVVALHVAVVGLAVWWAHRVAGPLGAWAVAAVFVGLAWAMGSEILVEPWQPHSLLPAFLAYLVLVWALVAGHGRALPWAAGLASLIIQTHLSYALLVPALAVLGTGAIVIAGVRRRGRRPALAELRAPLVVTAVVLAVAWAQPMVEQLAGDGNLGKVASSGAGDGPLAGPRFAGEVVASVLAVPGGWSPGGFDALHVDLEADRPPGEPPVLEGFSGASTALPWGAAMAALYGVAAWWSWRARDRGWGSAVVVAGSATLLLFVTIALLPVSPLLGVAAHQVRPAWPVALFTSLVVVASIVARRPRLSVVVAGLAAVLALAAIPAHSPRTGPSADAWAIPIVRDLVGQMDEVDDAGLVFVDLSVIRFAEPYSTPVLLELQRRGVELVVDDDIAVGQLGPRREREADDRVDMELRVVDGGTAATPEAGWKRIAYVPGLDAAERVSSSGSTPRRRLWTRRSRRGAADLERQRVFETAAVLVREV